MPMVRSGMQTGDRNRVFHGPAGYQPAGYQPAGYQEVMKTPRSARTRVNARMFSEKGVRKNACATSRSHEIKNLGWRLQGSRRFFVHTRFLQASVNPSLTGNMVSQTR